LNLKICLHQIYFSKRKGRLSYEGNLDRRREELPKKNKMIYDGQGQSDPEFTKEVADSLGAFATANLWSVDNLRKQLDQKNILIEKLHNDMQQMEVTSRERINFDMNQIRQGFEQQIKKLEEKLKLSVQNQHLSNNMVSQQYTLIYQLYTQINSFENTVMDISTFKKKTSEVN
jgi:hypothetical protein